METVFLQRLDVYPYRHRVAEVMARPPVTAPPDTSLAEAGRRMSHDQISSLVVVDEAGRPRGLLTEREVVQALGRHGAAAAALPLSAVMSRPVPTIRDDSFIYAAIGRMDRLKLRHLVAVDERGRVTGMVTVGRLLHLRASTALVIGDQLSLAERASEMACIRVGLPALASTLLAEGVPPAIIVAVISSVLRDMTARAAELAEQGMRADGWGEAPAPWCLLLLGSGGRSESVLSADQDNAIVHAGGIDEDRWFAELGERLCAILEEAGLPSCRGGVMASQAGWRQPLEGWRRTIDRWMVKVDGDDIINISVFIDFQPVRGEAGLAASLREYLTDKAARSAPLLHLMADNLQTIRAPLGVMGRFRSKRGLLDLKTSGLVPLVSAVRVLALKHRITATGTGARLAALAQGGWLNAPEAEALMAGHEMMMRLLLRQQIADSSIGRPVGNDIDLKRLSEEERAGLKDVFKAINALGWLLRNALSTV